MAPNEDQARDALLAAITEAAKMASTRLAPESAERAIKDLADAYSNVVGYGAEGYPEEEDAPTP